MFLLKELAYRFENTHGLIFSWGSIRVRLSGAVNKNGDLFLGFYIVNINIPTETL